jgi:hypothetical protein
MSWTCLALVPPPVKTGDGDDLFPERGAGGRASVRNRSAAQTVYSSEMHSQGDDTVSIHTKLIGQVVVE